MNNIDQTSTNGSNTQMKVYAKNCFDRFGDDLTELILQYLTFEDKVRLECVSKQWRRLVFNKQFVIELKEEETKNSLKRLIRRMADSELTLTVDCQSLESVLKNCPNIIKVVLDFKVSNEVLSLIGQYCHHIKSLTYYVSNSSDEEVLSFFNNYGHKLEELNLRGYESHENYENYEDQNDIDNYVKLIQQSCPNLKCIKIYYNSVLIDQDINLLPKLQNIGQNFNVNELKVLSDKYSQTMKILEVCLLTEEDNCNLMHISRFENLRSLKLKVFSTTLPIDESLSLIGQKCNKLLKLDLNIGTSVPISHEFFDALSEFKAIKRLKIELWNTTELNESIESLKHCNKLIELDISANKLSEEFFADIEIFVPKLQILRITTDIEYSDSFIDSFQSMKNIQSVHLYDKSNLNLCTKCWVFGKCLSEVMLSPKRVNVIRLYDNCGLISYIKKYD